MLGAVEMMRRGGSAWPQMTAAATTAERRNPDQSLLAGVVRPWLARARRSNTHACPHSPAHQTGQTRRRSVAGVPQGRTGRHTLLREALSGCAFGRSPGSRLVGPAAAPSPFPAEWRWCQPVLADYSGGSARDSHPLPYSLRPTESTGAPNARLSGRTAQPPAQGISSMGAGQVTSKRLERRLTKTMRRAAPESSGGKLPPIAARSSVVIDG